MMIETLTFYHYKCTCQGLYNGTKQVQVFRKHCTNYHPIPTSNYAINPLVFTLATPSLPPREHIPNLVVESRSVLQEAPRKVQSHIVLPIKSLSR